MACWKDRSWYIENREGNLVMLEGTAENLFWGRLVLGRKPKLFKRVNDARRIAAANDGIVRFYKGSPDHRQRMLPF